MKRLLLAGLLTAAAFGVAAPASATPLGQCGGTVDAVCRMDRCGIDYPCTPQICLVYLKGSCSI